MNIQVTDGNITRLLKEGKKDMILRQVVNMMPLPCLTCNKDIEFKPTDKPQVRCRRCDRGACPDCFPEPKNGWAYLCKPCNGIVMKQENIAETLLKKKKVGALPGTQAPIEASQPVNLTEDGDDTDEEEEDEEEWEEAARRREEKRQNEEGGRGGRKGESRREEAGGRNPEGRKEEREKEICKAFKFGGKCPHGNGCSVTNFTPRLAAGSWPTARGAGRAVMAGTATSSTLGCATPASIQRFAPKKGAHTGTAKAQVSTLRPRPGTRRPPGTPWSSTPSSLPGGAVLL